jgi:purine-binding chemotaxis protein CheW
MSIRSLEQIGNDEENGQEDTMEGRFLIFNLAEEEYGIEIRNITEIVGIQKITDLPDMPPYVKGVINLRGRVMPVIDVRLRFNILERAYDERTCIIIVKINDVSMGLIVDSVAEVQNIVAENVEDAPKIGREANHQYIKGLGKIGKEVKILLDTQKLLFEEEIVAITEQIA